MPSILLCLSLALVTIGWFQESKLKLEIGAKIPQEFIPADPEFMLNPAFLPFFEIERADVTFQILYDNEKQVIRYIHTSDADFRTSDGRFVGQCLEVTKEQVNPPTSGTAMGMKTQDRWIPIFGYLSHVVTCKKDYDDEEVTIPRSTMFAESDTISLQIVRFTKGVPDR